MMISEEVLYIRLIVFQLIRRVLTCKILSGRNKQYFLYFRSNKSLNFINEQNLDNEPNVPILDETNDIILEEEPKINSRIKSKHKSRSHHNSSSSGSQKSFKENNSKRSSENRSRYVQGPPPQTVQFRCLKCVFRCDKFSNEV